MQRASRFTGWISRAQWRFQVFALVFLDEGEEPTRYYLGDPRFEQGLGIRKCVGI